ncbi:MAG: hypothetical protein MK081_11855 [Flavobacteriales bacterium]|nr:hypothetical protein [Flavobacteriales bacterium]
MRLLLMAVGLLLANAIYSQTLQDFGYIGDSYDGYLYIGAMVKSSSVKNPGAPREEVHDLQIYNVDVNIRTAHFGWGEGRYSLNYKLLTDLLYIADDVVNDDGESYYRSESSSLSNGIIGWHGFGWNFIARDRLVVAAGFNFNDYFAGTSYLYQDSVETGLISNEPHGWYIASGPTIFADVLLTRFLILHAQSDFSMPFAKPVALSYGIDDPDYPHPHFFHFAAEVVTPVGIFVGADYSKLINRGDLHNNTSRLDINLGFKFVL